MIPSSVVLKWYGPPGSPPSQAPEPDLSLPQPLSSRAESKPKPTLKQAQTNPTPSLTTPKLKPSLNHPKP